MQETRLCPPALIIMTTFVTVIGLCISLSIYAAGMIWPDHPPSWNVHAQTDVPQNHPAPQTISLAVTPTTITAPEAPLPFLIETIARPMHRHGNTGYPIAVPGLLSATKRSTPDDLSSPWNGWSVTSINDQTITAAIEWPQRVDHEAVLLITSSLLEPDTGRYEAVTPAIGDAGLRPRPLDLPSPALRTTAISGAVKLTPPPIVKPEEPTKVASVAPNPADVVEANSEPKASVQHQPIRLGYGKDKQVAVLGVYQSRSSAWALLEMSDGSIVKATKGSDLEEFTVSRIRDDKVWIRMGGTEKGLAVGQVFVLK